MVENNLVIILKLIVCNCVLTIGLWHELTSNIKLIVIFVLSKWDYFS